MSKRDDVLNPKLPIWETVVGWLALLLHFAAVTGTWALGFPGGLRVDYQAGDLARANGAFLGANLLALLAIYLGLRLRPMFQSRLLIVAGAIGLALTFWPHWGSPNQLYAAGRDAPASTRNALYWSGTARERQLPQPDGAQAADDDLFHADVLGRIDSTYTRFRHGLVYNLARSCGGIGQTFDTLGLPFGQAIRQRASHFLLANPRLHPAI